MLVPLSFWEEARERLEKIDPEVIMFAEGFTKNNQRKAFDIDYLFNWYQTLQRVYLGKSPASEIRKMWTDAFTKSLPGTRYVHYLESHDTTCKSLDSKRPNKIWGPELIDTALVLNFTIDGVPWLYNGQEAADTARHNIHATKGSLTIDWPNANASGGKVRFALCQKLCKLRHIEKALTHGTMIWLDNSAPGEVLSFLRTTDKEQILVLINMTKKDVSVTVTMPSDAKSNFQPLLARDAEETINVDGKKTFALKDCGLFVGKQD